MKVLILGGSRFIGFHLAQECLRRGDAVTLFSRGVTPFPAPLPAQVQRLRGDRYDTVGFDRTIRELFSKESFDAVFDLTGYTPKDLGPFLHIDPHKIGHYIFCSTTLAGISSNEYGQDKAQAEQALFARKGLLASAVRTQGVLGPYDFGAAAWAFARLARGLPVLALESKSSMECSTIDVRDLVARLLKLSSKTGEEIKPEPSTLVSPCAPTAAELVQTCAQVSKFENNKPLLLADDNKVPEILKTKGAFFPWVDERLVQECSDSKPFYSLAETLQNIWNWGIADRDRHFPLIYARGEREWLARGSIPRWKNLAWKVARRSGMNI